MIKDTCAFVKFLKGTYLLYNDKSMCQVSERMYIICMHQDTVELRVSNYHLSVPSIIRKTINA